MAQRPSTENRPNAKSEIDLAFEVLFINRIFFLTGRGSMLTQNTLQRVTVLKLSLILSKSKKQFVL